MSKEFQIAFLIGVVLFGAFFLNRIFLSKSSLSERVTAIEVKVEKLEKK